MNMPDYLWTPIWCLQHLSSGLEAVYEADACPNNLFYGSGKRLAASASTMLANGMDGLWYWLTGVGGTESGDPVPNLESYERCYPDLAAVGKEAQQGSAVGISTITPAAARLLARYGVPYKTTNGGVEMYAGEDAFDGKSDEEIRKILSGRVMLDGDAAKKLTERGFTAEIGAKAWGEKAFNVRGSVDFTGELIKADNSRVGSSFHANYGLDSSVVRWLEPVGAGEEISFYFTGKDKRRVQSAVTRTTNALGGKVVVFAPAFTGSTANNLLNYRKRRLVIELIEWLGGEEAMPVRTDRQVNVLVFANANENRLFVHATQLSCQPAEALSFIVAPSWRGGSVEVLENGLWKPVGAVAADGRVTIKRPTTVFDVLAFKVK